MTVKVVLCDVNGSEREIGRFTQGVVFEKRLDLFESVWDVASRREVARYVAGFWYDVTEGPPVGSAPFTQVFIHAVEPEAA